jgi:hypothetical protein
MVLLTRPERRDSALMRPGVHIPEGEVQRGLRQGVVFRSTVAGHQAVGNVAYVGHLVRRALVFAEAAMMNWS